MADQPLVEETFKSAARDDEARYIDILTGIFDRFPADVQHRLADYTQSRYGTKAAD